MSDISQNNIATRDLSQYPNVEKFVADGHTLTLTPWLSGIEPFHNYSHARIAPGHRGDDDNAIGATDDEALRRLDLFLKEATSR